MKGVLKSVVDGTTPVWLLEQWDSEVDLELRG
jgi:hypothetical protein